MIGDPRVRLLLLFAVGAAAVLLDRPTSLGILAGLTTATLVTQPIGRTRLVALGVAGTVVWSTALSQGLFYADHPRTPLVGLGPIVLYREGLTHGLVQSLRLISTAMAGLAVALSTPPDRLIAGVTALKLPWGPAFLAVTALRAVPVIADELWIVRHARARRGRPAHHRSPWAWIRLEMALLIPVAARSLRRARTLADALDARGFDPATPPTAHPPLCASRSEVLLVVLVYSGLAAMLTAELMFQAYLAELYHAPALRPLYGWVRTWL